jgi:hypothetical protein
MPPTPAEIAQQIADRALEIADLARGLTGVPPAPQGAPVKPTGLQVRELADGRLELVWDDDATVDTWGVLDLANAAQPLKEVVTAPWSIRSRVKPGSPPRHYAVVARNTAGESPASDVVVVGAPTGEQPPPPPPWGGRLPTDVLPALTTWTITTTTGQPGKPTNNYPAKLGGEIPNVFYVTGDSGVMFRATVDGVTTPNSKRCRVEARQMADDNWTKAAWNGDEPHSLDADLWISTANLHKRKQVSALQIHDGGDDVLQVLADAEAGLIVKANDGKTIRVLDPDYQDGQRFTCRIATGLNPRREDGRDTADVAVTYYGHDGPPVTELFPDKVGTSWYFKAGCYNQASIAEHGEPPTAYGEVCIYSLAVTGRPVA